MTLTELALDTELRYRPAPWILDRAVGLPCAWCRDRVRRAEYLVRPDAAVLSELDWLARDLAGYDGALAALVPEDFDLPATAALMARVRHKLERGVGFALLDRLPVARWDEAASKAVVWLLSGHLGLVVNQKWRGTRIYEVRDTGKTIGYGVRRSITNLGQEFHTDGGWLAATPEVVGLACLRQARRGGISHVASLARAHDVLRRHHPEHLAALYRPLWWNRQAEHPKGQMPCSRLPVFAWDGVELSARYYDDYIRSGHALMGVPLPPAAGAALDALRAVVELPENRIAFRLAPGQIEYVNNRLLAHARTAFEDSGRPDRGRLLLRLWIRRAGGVELEPGLPSGA